MRERPELEPRSLVVVPVRPGPVVRLDHLDRSRDDVDAAFDDAFAEVFGEPDDRGPSVVDGVLLAGDLGVVVVAQVASWPGIATVAGAGAVALGAILPLRSLGRRVGAVRRERRLASIVGDGSLLRIDHPSTRALVDAHERLTTGSTRLAASPHAQVSEVAHAAIQEVATLLAGRVPSTPSELDYVAARTGALTELAAALDSPGVGDGDRERRDALVEARREIEQVDGTSTVHDAAELVRRLRGEHGA